MRRPFVGGNWKMNGSAESGQDFMSEMSRRRASAHTVETVLFPPFTIMAGLSGAASAAGVQLGSVFDFLAPVKAAELILFTKQFNTLIRAGVPMLSLLKVLVEQTEHPKLRTILESIHRDIKEGSSLNDAFRRHQNVFSPLHHKPAETNLHNQPVFHLNCRLLT